MEPKNPNPDPNARPVPFPLGRLAALLAGVLLLWGLAATPLPRGIAAVPEEVPSPSPSPSPVPAEPVRLLAVGDLMVHQPQLEAARRGPDSWDFRPQIAPLADLLREGDLTVGNLEVTLGGGRGGYTGYPVFSAPDDLAETLKEAGFDLLFTANNHCLDRGEAGALRTLEVLDRLDLAHTGTFPASRDPAPAVLSAGGITFAFLSYTYGTNGIPVPSGVRVNGTQEARIAADVRAARGTSADLVVVGLHYGPEYRTEPHASQLGPVRAALEAGADLILGGHPHVLQRVDVLSPDRPGGTHRVVAWSLGNFVSSQRTVPRDRGAVLEIRAARGADGVARILRVGAAPLWVRFEGRGARQRIQAEPLPPGSSGAAGAARRQVLELLTRGARGQTPLRRDGVWWVLFEAPASGDRTP